MQINYYWTAASGHLPQAAISALQVAGLRGSAGAPANSTPQGQ